MPKRRSYNFKSFETTSNTQQNATTNGESSSSASSRVTRSVNERLAQLRAEQTPRPTLAQRDEMTSIATTPTLPPNLRSILKIPEPLPPQPRRRWQRLANGRRAPPGPAAPKSWSEVRMDGSRHQFSSSVDAGKEARAFSQLATLQGPHQLPNKGSLVDQTLKTMARNWTFIAEYEQHNLTALPIQWKTALLSYLGSCGPIDGVTARQLKTLFKHGEDVEEITGSDGLIRLDMTRLITDIFTLPELERFLYRKVEVSSEALDEQINRLALDSDRRKDSKPGRSVTVADSWEDEATAEDVQLIPGLKVRRFPNLTRLSLAHAGSYASWPGLLSLVSHTPTLTHLSLAHWPRPTATPNATNAFITHRHATIPVSGSHIYSGLDDDWSEPANILRRLSNLTYCLEWLDLHGCEEWLPALTWQPESGNMHRDRWVNRTFGNGPPNAAHTAVEQLNTRVGMSDLDITESTLPGPDWNGSWSQITYLNVSQRLIPCDVHRLQAYPAGVIAAELLHWLRGHGKTSRHDLEQGKSMNIPEWLQREKDARGVEEKVRELRKGHGGRYCEFDFGWKRKITTRRSMIPTAGV